MIWTVQNNFGPIEDINIIYFYFRKGLESFGTFWKMAGEFEFEIVFGLIVFG